MLIPTTTYQTRFPTSLARELKQHILQTILIEGRLRLIVIIPALADEPGDPLSSAHTFLFPLLREWEVYRIDWMISMIALPNQNESFIRLDLSTNRLEAEEGQRRSSFPIYTLVSDTQGIVWNFELHTTRGNTQEEGLLVEFKKMCLRS